MARAPCRAIPRAPVALPVAAFWGRGERASQPITDAAATCHARRFVMARLPTLSAAGRRPLWALPPAPLSISLPGSPCTRLDQRGSFPRSQQTRGLDRGNGKYSRATVKAAPPCTAVQARVRLRSALPGVFSFWGLGVEAQRLAYPYS
jgi:hypothetical protein